VDTAVARLIAGLRFHLDARIGVSKVETRGATDVPRSADGEMLDVAVYDATSGGDHLLYAGKHRVVGNRIDVALDLPSKPAFIVADPFIRRIDRLRTNNRRALTTP
jgi:hypothetical protein